MNSKAQIAEAFEDFNSGRFGRIAPQTRSSAPMNPAPPEGEAGAAFRNGGVRTA
jgi:hypothetical protein